VEVPVGQERELERRDGALDRHVDEVDDQASAVEALERRRQRRRAFRRVEGEGALVPTGAGEAIRLLGLQVRSRGDDEHVVGESGAVVEQELVPLRPDRVDLSLVEDDSVAQLSCSWPDDLVQGCEPERDEEEPRLVDVAVVPIDDVDLGLVGVEASAQAVGDHRAASAAAQDDDPRARHEHRVPPLRPPAIRGYTDALSENYARLVACERASSSAQAKSVIDSPCLRGRRRRARAHGAAATRRRGGVATTAMAR
jgi:hypothetical protein